MGMYEEGVMRVYDRKSVARYVRSGGCKCVFCGSSSVEGDSVDVDKGGATQRCFCSECGGEWSDVYDLVGVAVDLELVVPGKR